MARQGLKSGHRHGDKIMDYAVALIVYFASLAGIVYSIAGMITFKMDKWMVRFCSLTCFAFTGTMYIGGAMLSAMGN